MLQFGKIAHTKQDIIIIVIIIEALIKVPLTAYTSVSPVSPIVTDITVEL